MFLPSIVFDKQKISDFNQAIRNEWLVTNGLGGYGSSTTVAMNTRKYHALLVASLRPPGERTVVLSKLDEDLSTGNMTYQLGSNDFRNNIYPKGFAFLSGFSVSPFPKYTYTAEEFKLNKTIFLPYGTNSCIALYELTNFLENDVNVKIYPLISYRHFHYTINRQIKPVKFSQTQTDNSVELAFDDPTSIAILKGIAATNFRFIQQGNWVDNLVYREEIARGESAEDESYQPGYFQFNAPKKSTIKFAVAISVDQNRDSALNSLNSFGANVSDIEGLLSEQQKALEDKLTSFYGNTKTSPNEDLSWLLLAANDFVVSGIKNKRFVIAGYDWFGSWGRDTFVSLPGLMLVNGRFEDAKNVILDYASFWKQGLIPNLIDDKTGQPLYNTVDGTLWFINSILQYVKYTGDYKFVQDSLWGTLSGMVEDYKKGTFNDIRIDGDGLLAHGEQLTWMDTIVEGAPFTPRGGKAVEVEALWYNALRTLQLLAEEFQETNTAADLSAMATKAQSSFNGLFWNEDTNSLFDVIDQSGRPDRSIRPNQLIACSLDFPIVNDPVKTISIVNYVISQLLTPAGLRTLSPLDPRYKGKYEGDRTSRDRAYHNGSIWAWLSGPLTTAYVKAMGNHNNILLYANKTFIEPLLSRELRRGGLGTISEINDGDSPYTPRGCIAQAWSVAELLRAYTEDILQIKPKYSESKPFVTR